MEMWECERAVHWIVATPTPSCTEYFRNVCGRLFRPDLSRDRSEALAIKHNERTSYIIITYFNTGGVSVRVCACASPKASLIF